MIDINLDTLDTLYALNNLDLVNQASFKNFNAPMTADLNLSENRILEQNFLDKIISEVNNVGVSIIPQSEFQKKLVSSLNIDNVQESFNNLENYYNIQVLNGNIDFKEFYSKKSNIQNILENKNTIELDKAFELEGGVKNVLNQNKKFFDNLDYEGTLNLYSLYLKEKNAIGVFYNDAEFVSETSFAELKDLQKNPNPNKLAGIVQDLGGIESLVNKTANIISETNEFYDQRKAINLGPDIVKNGLDYSNEFSKFELDVKKDNNLKIKNTIKLNY